MFPTTKNAAVKPAMTAIASESVTTQEKIQMLIKTAVRFRKQPKTVKDLRHAVSLYYHAYEMCGENYPLLQARAKVGMAGTLRAIPDVGTELLLQAKAGYEEAIPILQQLGVKEEVAEAQMNLGLVLQSLVAFNLARIADCIEAYQAALGVFTWQDYPQEYAILHNNIAIAYLSMPAIGDREHLQQELAVKSFESALQHINLIEHPREYAMLQNNLGNALQSLSVQTKK